MKIHTYPRRALSAAGIAAVATVGLAGPASAHVTASSDTTAAGAYAVLTFSVPHGCEGSASTKVVVQMPKDILAATPTRHPFWDVEVGTKKLAEPVKDAHGNVVTERDATVTYTAKTPLPDGQRDAFELSVKLPDTADKTLTFPTIQTCEEGETSWTEVAASGQDEEELEHPAPALTLTAAEAGDPADATEATDEATSTSGLSWLALGVGALGLLTGVVALISSRRKA